MLRQHIATASASGLMAAAVLTGCAVTVNEGSPSTSCSPAFEPGNQYGRLSVQQRNPGNSIQWGFYPNVAVSTYQVNIYLGSRRFDGKNQNYPPHGSVPASAVTAGVTFRIDGRATNPKGDILVFGLRCRA